MWNNIPTYSQVKEFWTGYLNTVQKFYSDWVEDVKSQFDKKN